MCVIIEQLIEPQEKLGPFSPKFILPWFTAYDFDHKVC